MSNGLLSWIEPRTPSLPSEACHTNDPLTFQLPTRHLLHLLQFLIVVSRVHPTAFAVPAHPIPESLRRNTSKRPFFPFQSFPTTFRLPSRPIHSLSSKNIELNP